MAQSEHRSRGSGTVALLIVSSLMTADGRRSHTSSAFIRGSMKRDSFTVS